MNIDKIREQIPKAALYEQLAEEAVELAHAALKYARILREENPTPCDRYETIERVSEELLDIIIVMDVLRVNQFERSKYNAKLQRWIDRLEAAKK